MPRLRFGQRVNIPGPAYFPLWPGQHASVIPGHLLRSNQFLVVRVYNETAAAENWSRAVVRRQTSLESGENRQGSGAVEQTAQAASTLQRPQELTMGQLLIIKGTEVSFYIPPTGIEVLVEDGQYVREAVTLEQLEYCILISEDGKKRYVEGPAVVFPEPTEQFVSRDGRRKFRAIELNEISAIHVKVVAPYEEGDRRHEVGEELFISGRQQAIYYPRDEHVIIKYGDEQPVHFAVAVPAGEGRYVLDRLTGNVKIVRGPTMLLSDPRKEVIVLRVLDEGTVRLWFPGNERAIEVNNSLRKLNRVPAEPLVRHDVERFGASGTVAKSLASRETAGGFLSEEFERRSQFTPPRSITLDTKYDGAVMIDVWTGYAVLVTNRQGRRRVVAGPDTFLLEYDETLMPMELSTGNPKTTDRLERTVYLRVHHNRVSDTIEVETKDLCKVSLKVSYRVNFEGDKEKWFDVENYVKFLTDHLRSMLRSATKRHGVEEFYEKATAIIRDSILGESQQGQRPGRSFAENGMRVYDVEVLGVEIKDQAIAQLLVKNQQDVVRTTLEAESEERKLTLTKRTEVAKRGTAATLARTRRQSIELQQKEVKQNLRLALEKVTAAAEEQAERLYQEKKQQDTLNSIAKAGNKRTVAEAEAKAKAAKHQAEQLLDKMKQETEELVKRAGAVSPDLVAALKAFQDADNVDRLSKAVAPLAILGGTSVVEVIKNLFKDTPLAAIAENLTGSNGGSRQPVSSRL